MFMRIDLSSGFSAVAPPQAYDIRTPPPSPFPPIFGAHRRAGSSGCKEIDGPSAGDRENAVKHYRLAAEINPGESDYAKRVLENSKAKLKELGEDR
jgi:hypothetical protein